MKSPSKRTRKVASGTAVTSEAATLPSLATTLPQKVNVLVNVFTYDEYLSGAVFVYGCGVGPALANHPRVENVVVSYSHGYPTTRCRNYVAQKAKTDGFHVLLMLDDDMRPDVELGRDAGAKPFLQTALDFMLAHESGPCVVGAPYCGSPPEQRVMVMKNVAYAPDMPGGAGVKIQSYSRDEAAVQTGVGRVSALPTGCLLIDLRVLDILPPPWFEYEFADPPFNTALASTEDVVFTRNLDWLRIPQYAAWDSWAGHMKRYTTAKPRLAPVDAIPVSIWEAWSKGWRPAATFDGTPIPKVV